MKCTDDGIRRVKENSKEELVLRVTNIDSKPGALTKKFSVTDDREILEAIASHRVSSLIDSCGARLNSFVKFLDYAFLETNGKQSLIVSDACFLDGGVWKRTHSNPILQDMKVGQKRAQESMEKGESSKKAVIKEVFIKEISDRSYRWSFRARVTHKNKLIHFNTKRSGCIMSFDVVDVQGTEIRIIGSDDCALVLSDKIVQGTVYSFSGSGGIRRSNQAYTPFEATWEIQANKGMEFTALDEDATFPRIVLAKTSILSACQKERDSFVDVVGIVIWIGTITVTSRDSGTFVKKRTLCLGDDSGHSVDLCLWDLKAEEEGSYIQERIDSGVQPIICVKGGKVSDYNGKSLSAIGVSTILIEPEMEAVADLREWMTLYYNVTNFIHLSTSSSRQTVSCTTTLSEISNMQLKVLESSPIYRVIATVKEMKTDEFYYNACINVVNARQCGKKTTRTADGWFCSYCNIESANMEFKYALKMCIEDSSSHVWAIAFQEAAQEIVGMSAKELATMRDENYPAFSLLIDGIRSKIYKFKIRSKLEKYQDMEKLRFYILGLDT